MSTKKESQWSPFGEEFADNKFVMVPLGLWAVLNHLNFTGDKSRAVVMIFSLLRRGSYRVVYRQRDIAYMTSCTTRTVYTTIEMMKSMGARLVKDGAKSYDRRSELDLFGFIATLREASLKIKENEAKFKNAPQLLYPDEELQ
jgi:hypothetical protein